MLLYIRKHFLALKIVLFLALITPGYGKVVDVIDFGAVGDGETDNTAYFQNALDSLKEEGGIVFVPAGRPLATASFTGGIGMIPVIRPFYLKTGI
jgi:hypothetical protein